MTPFIINACFFGLGCFAGRWITLRVLHKKLKKILSFSESKIHRDILAESLSAKAGSFSNGGLLETAYE